MKRITGLLMLLSLLGTTILEAQETTSLPSAPAQTGAQTGEATVEAAVTATSNDWENWVFAGCALAVVVAGVVIVSLNQGRTLHGQ